MGGYQSYRSGAHVRTARRTITADDAGFIHDHAERASQVLHQARLCAYAATSQAHLLPLPPELQARAKRWSQAGFHPSDAAMLALTAIPDTRIRTYASG